MLFFISSGILLILSLIGLIGTLKLNLCLMYFHAIVQAVFSGGLTTYLIISTAVNGIFTREVTFIIGIPLLFIILVSCFSLYFCLVISRFIKGLRYEGRAEVPQDQRGLLESAARKEQKMRAEFERTLCVLCRRNPIDQRFVPCGHRQVCFACMTDSAKRSQVDKCPLCKASVDSILKDDSKA